MTFSIRTFLLVIGVLACWLGAMVSNSPLLVELVATATSLLILLTLALAIWEPRAEQRAFWTGFFVLAFGNMILAHFNAYQQTGHEAANAILGQPKPQPVSLPRTPAFNSPMMAPSYTPAPSLDPAAPDTAPSLPSNTSYYQPPYSPVPYPSSSYVPVYTQVADNYYQRHAAIRTAVPSLLSLVAGVIGGWLTMWVYRRAKGAEKIEPASSGSESSA